MRDSVYEQLKDLEKYIESDYDLAVCEVIVDQIVEQEESKRAELVAFHHQKLFPLMDIIDTIWDDLSYLDKEVEESLAPTAQLLDFVWDTLDEYFTTFLGDEYEKYKEERVQRVVNLLTKPKGVENEDVGSTSLDNESRFDG